MNEKCKKLFDLNKSKTDLEGSIAKVDDEIKAIDKNLENELQRLNTV